MRRNGSTILNLRLFLNVTVNIRIMQEKNINRLLPYALLVLPYYGATEVWRLVGLVLSVLSCRHNLLMMDVLF